MKWMETFKNKDSLYGNIVLWRCETKYVISDLIIFQQIGRVEKNENCI